MSARQFAPVLVRVRAWRAGETEPHAGFGRAYRAPRPLALQAAMRHARAAFKPEDRVRIEADIVDTGTETGTVNGIPETRIMQTESQEKG